MAADPASDAVPEYWVFGTELPQDLNRHVRHHMFAIVDRTGFGDDSQDRVGPFFEFNGNRLPPSEAADGRKYKMLITPLVLESQTPTGPTLLIAEQAPQVGGSDSIWIDIAWPTMVADAAGTQEAGITKFGSKLLTIQGDETYSGAFDGVVILNSSLPGSDSELARRNLMTTNSVDLERPGGTAGTHALYQDIFIPA